MVDNTYLGFNLNGGYELNGTTVEVAPCANGTDLLCNSDGAVVTTYNAQPVTDFLHGGPYSGLSVQQLDSRAYGVSAQATDAAPLGSHVDKRFYTYGSFGPVSDVPWPNIPGGVTDPRTASPGTPVTVYGGVRLTF